MTTVYLSSTFRDLKEYREEVLKYFRSLKESFRVLNMEDYVAEDRSAYDKCMADVACCDLYILLMGNTYGSIARDAANATFNTEGYSYTELEYRMARQCTKEVFVFKASAQANLAGDPDPKKLTDFWAGVNGILTPREFDSPLHLAVQVAQSISHRFIKATRVNEKLAYLCDRSLHNTDFLLGNIAATSPFRSVVVNGPSQELCDNFVNRVSFYDLSFDDRKLGNPISFDSFLSGRNYEANLQRFLICVYAKLGVPLPPAPPLSLVALNAAQQLRNEPLVMAIGYDVEMLEAPHIEFLEALLGDCAAAAGEGKPSYLFICLEEAPDNPAAATEIAALATQKADEIAALSPGSKQSVIRLPRLDAIKRADIKTWLQEEITPDEGTASQIMNLFFADLPKTGITMETAHARISAFINKMNARAPETDAFINLY